MTTCPVCDSATLATDAAGIRYCPVCAACGRDPLVGGSRMAAGEPATPVRGSSEAHGARSGRCGNKFGAIRTEVDGIVFHSRAEARRYEALKLLEAAGEIAGLSLQPSFDLIVNGCLVCRYRADFEYTEAGARVIEDVKGEPSKTAFYKLKKKLMLACHGIQILETS